LGYLFLEYVVSITKLNTVGERTRDIGRKYLIGSQ